MAKLTPKTTLDAVEKVLLGATPDDPVAINPALGTEPNPQAARLTAVRKYFEAQPELRAALDQEITKAWKAAGGERTKFLGAIAEQRARILTLAAITGARPQVQQAATDFQRELSRYLMEREGAGGDGVIV